MVKQLRIPKARQKQLRAIMDEARAKLVAQDDLNSAVAAESKIDLQNASPAS
jgi:hypothetical protein